MYLHHVAAEGFSSPQVVISLLEIKDGYNILSKSSSRKLS